MDILLAHAYFIADDLHEQKIMKPYPPLGLLYIASYLKQQGFAVRVFDGTFQTMEDFVASLDAEKPPVLGIYVNMMTKRHALTMIQHAKRRNIKVILGGLIRPTTRANIWPGELTWSCAGKGKGR